MKLRWTAAVLFLVLLLASDQVDAQKRRKGDKKKEEATGTKPDAKVETKPEPKGEHAAGRHRHFKTTTEAPTTTTTTTTTTTPAPIEEEIDEELAAIDLMLKTSNACPAELKPQADGLVLSPCICRDDLDDSALMVECVALNDAAQMQQIFKNFLMGKRLDAIEVRNSTLGPLVADLTSQSYITSVVLRGNQITDLTADTFKGTDQYISRLDLGSNLLTSIKFSIFDNFPQLQVLNLRDNQLSTIEDAGQAPSLRVLHLASNQISAIAPRAFKGLQALEYLDLRWNNLQVLAPGSLQVTSSRWQLRLRGNQLATLEDVFSQDNVPYLVDLSQNNIGTLTDVVYGPLIESALLEASKMYIGGNPIQCDCSLAWLLKNTRLSSAVVGARCSGDGVPIADLNLEEFRKCPPPKPWFSPLDRAMAELAREVEQI